MNPRGSDTVRGEVSMDLTPREREVARLIASGHSSKQIAVDLEISFRTVVSHRFRIFQKLGVTNTAELVAQAVRMGLVDFFSGSNVPLDSDQPISYRMTAMREENTRERQILAALITESKLLREQSVATRKGLEEARHQVMVQVFKLVEALKHASSENPQALSDVRGDTSGLHVASAKHVHAAGKNVSAAG